MTREEEIRNAIDTIFPTPPSEKGRKYEQALMATGFEAGVKWADANPKSPWISVDEDLPCNHKELIHGTEVSEGTETIEVFARNEHGDIWDDYMVYEDGKWRWNDFEPSYWMIAPKLPKKIGDKVMTREEFKKQIEYPLNHFITNEDVHFWERNHIKATIGRTLRLALQYPNLAQEYLESFPKATMD